MKKLNLLDKIIFFLNTIVAVSLLLSYLLPFFPPKTFAVLSVLSLGVPFLILTNILFLLYWLLKMKRQVLLSALILIIGYFSFGSFYKFSSTVIESDDALSIMNFNVRLFNLYEWIPEKSIETKIVDLIKNESPDVLSLQEYHPHKNIDLSFYKYKFEKLSGTKTRYGQAIFSKYPIINQGSIEFPNTSNNAIYVDIIKESDTIRVYNIHLQSLHIDANVDNLAKEDSEKLFKRVGNTFKMQQFQTELFLLHKEECKYKMIVCGDFNNTAFSYAYREIRGDLIDSFNESGSGFGSTYDFKFFPIRIDFILADKSFTVNKFKTFNEKLSDHYPIMTFLQLH